MMMVFVVFKLLVGSDFEEGVMYGIMVFVYFDNLFVDYSIVFVLYCIGDVYIGNCIGFYMVVVIDDVLE